MPEVRNNPRDPAASSSQTSGSRSSTSGGNIGWPHGPKEHPSGIIIIPIGLIIFLVIAVLRMLGGSAQKNSYPKSDVNTLNMGLYYYDQGDYEKAIVHFSMAIVSQPDMGEAYNDRGLAYYTMGETENAIADFNKAIELLPNPAVSYSNRGGVCIFSRATMSKPWQIWIKRSNFLHAPGKGIS